MTLLDVKEIFEREFKNYLATLKKISSEQKGPSLINDQGKGNFFSNIAVMPDDLFKEKHLNTVSHSGQDEHKEW